MTRLLIVGAGGHGKVVADAALLAGWSDVAFLDDRAGSLDKPLGLPVVGTLASLESMLGQYASVLVAIGDAQRRLALLERCRAAGFELPSVVHPAASVSRFASIGEGTAVFAQAAINADTRLGRGCIVNTGATIDHDCQLGHGVHVCPGAHLAGNVSVGDLAWLGIGAVVRQGIKIGQGTVVGAGGVVVSDVPAGATVVGVPARQRSNAT